MYNLQADFVDLGGEAVDKLACRGLEILFEILHDVHTNIVASVKEDSHEYAKTGVAGFGRPFA